LARLTTKDDAVDFVEILVTARRGALLEAEDCLRKLKAATVYSDVADYSYYGDEE